MIRFERKYAPAIAALRNKFHMQKGAARLRGIEFLLTFEEWLSVWESSGKLHLRGCKRGCYQMARKNDTGPYSIDNVRICTAGENTTEAWETNGASRAAKIAAALTGQKRGPQSTAHRQKISATTKGLKRSEEAKENMRLARLRRKGAAYVEP